MTHRQRKFTNKSPHREGVSKSNTQLRFGLAIHLKKFLHLCNSWRHARTILIMAPCAMGTDPTKFATRT
jgi:hypothetical protein